MTKTPKTRVEELRRIADDLTNIEAVLDTIQENDLTEMSGFREWQGPFSLHVRYTPRPHKHRVSDDQNRCKDCGKDLVWVGPGIYDWELVS